MVSSVHAGSFFIVLILYSMFSKNANAMADINKYLYITF